MSPKEWWDEQNKKLQESTDKLKESVSQAAKAIGKGDPKKIMTGTFNSRGIVFLFGDGTSTEITQRFL